MQVDKAKFETYMANIGNAEAKLASSIHALRLYVELVLNLPVDLTLTDGYVTTLAGLSVYQHDGALAAPESEWPQVFEAASATTPVLVNGQPVYTFLGDTANQPPKGDGLGGVWHALKG